jgi:hypothetical protein
MILVIKNYYNKIESIRDSWTTNHYGEWLLWGNAKNPYHIAVPQGINDADNPNFSKTG